MHVDSDRHGFDSKSNVEMLKYQSFTSLCTLCVCAFSANRFHVQQDGSCVISCLVIDAYGVRITDIFGACQMNRVKDDDDDAAVTKEKSPIQTHRRTTSHNGKDERESIDFLM